MTSPVGILILSTEKKKKKKTPLLYAMGHTENKYTSAENSSAMIILSFR